MIDNMEEVNRQEREAKRKRKALENSMYKIHRIDWCAFPGNFEKEHRDRFYCFALSPQEARGAFYRLFRERYGDADVYIESEQGNYVSINHFTDNALKSLYEFTKRQIGLGKK